MDKPTLLWGGVDVDSALYNEPRNKYAQRPNKQQDIRDQILFNDAVLNDKPIIGVCRGAQMLCILNGGSLYQHSEPERQNHSLLTLDGILFDSATAGHHQVMNPRGVYTVYAWNPGHVEVWHDDERHTSIKNTAEVVYWPQTKSLGIQPHPEWAAPNDPFVIWLNGLIKKLDIDYQF